MNMNREVVIYTDGSSLPNPGRGGWGYIAVFNDYDIYCNGYEKHTTNNIMEMTAVIEAVKDFKDFNNIHIYSDSKYVINCAQGLWKRKKNTELWKQYDYYTKGKNIRFTWVKGHNGDHYNELVDKLSTEYKKIFK
jgi:ribonuclease HI